MGAGVTTGDPPTMRPWNLALRFVLEVVALTGVALGVGTSDLPASWVLAAVAVAGLAAVWGAFGVPGDPSRGKTPPVRVPGYARLTLEVVIFFLGLAGFLAAGHAWAALATGALITVHHVADPARGGWLLLQR